MEEFLQRHGVLFKRLKGFVLQQAERLWTHSHVMAERASRPWQYFESPGAQGRAGPVQSFLDRAVHRDVRRTARREAPYNLETNDFTLVLTARLPGPELGRAVKDHFDQLWLDGEPHGRSMAIGIHSFISGQPLRTRYV